MLICYPTFFSFPSLHYGKCFKGPVLPHSSNIMFRPVPFIPRDGTGRGRDGIFKMEWDCAFTAYNTNFQKKKIARAVFFSRDGTGFSKANRIFKIPWDFLNFK